MKTRAVNRQVAGVQTTDVSFARKFIRNRLALMMFAILAVLIAVAIFADVLAPFPPNRQDLQNAFAPMGSTHLLGTDELGRDVLSRLIVSARITLLAGAIATVVSMAIGIPLGLLAGYSGGRVDAALGRVVDALMAIPPLLLAMGIVAVLGPGVGKAMIAVGVVSSPRFFRVTRSVTMVVKTETYVEAARSLGKRPVEIIARHVVPNIASALIVQVSLTIGVAILAEASLSFLGLGVQLPDASWGSMLKSATTYGPEHGLLVLLPGLLIMITVLAFNTVGDGLRDAMGRKDRRL